MSVRASLACALTVLLLGASVAPASYQFLHYQHDDKGYTAIPERYDLSALPGRRVNYLIAQQGPAKFADGDSLVSLVSQIRAAAETWNSVDTSQLKVAFGGFFTPDVKMNTPHIEVVFSDEIPPGILALGGPITPDPLTADNVNRSGDTPFVPITRAQVVLSNDLSSQPTSTDSFFLTLVHEFGHALGLQHTWTNSVMSTSITRTTTKASPLGADDVTGLSSLYPTQNFSRTLGSISGRVTMGDNGVVLASVVALTMTGPAVSTLTAPDGTYQISGLAPGDYHVFVQPVPPSLPGELQPVNLVLPDDLNGHDYSPSSPFTPAFYGNTITPQNTVTVKAGEATSSIDFAVNGRASTTMHSVQTYTFIGQVANKPATIFLDDPNPWLVLYGNALTNGHGPVPTLNIFTLGGPETIPPDSVQAYSQSGDFIQMNLQLSKDSTDGPRHLFFSLGTETHIAPSVIRIAKNHPPSIDRITPVSDHVIVASGANLNAGTRLMVDGVAAATQLNDDGSLTAVLPPAPSNYTATLSALNADGLTSGMVTGSSAKTLPLPSAEDATVTLNPASLAAGTEGLIDITTKGTRLPDGQLSLGFGTSDLTTFAIWPVSPTHAYALVGASANAQQTPTTATLMSGLQITAASSAFQATGTSSSMYLPLIQAGLTSVPQAWSFDLPVANLPAFATKDNTVVTFGGEPAPVLNVDTEHQIVRVYMPLLQPLGPNPAVVTVDGVSSFPSVLVVTPSLPEVLRAFDLHGQPITGDNAPARGDTIQIEVVHLGDPASFDSSRLKLKTGDVEHAVLNIQKPDSIYGIYSVVFQINPATPAGDSFPLTVTWDGRNSTGTQIAVRP